MYVYCAFVLKPIEVVGGGGGSGMSVLKNQSMCSTRTCGDVVVVCIHDLLFQEMKVRW